MPRRGQVVRTARDIGLGIGVYYALRLAGVSVFAALLTGAVLSLVTNLWTIARTRRVDGIGVYFTGLLLLGLAVSLISGSPRFLLAKEGWLLGASGVCFLLSARMGRPMAFSFARPLLEWKFGVIGASWDALWENEPRFRRIWRVSSVMWGVGLLIDGAARVTMAYSLPIDLVPALGAAQYFVFAVVMQPITGVYYWHAGLWQILRAEGAERAARAQGGQPAVAG